jgi:hypothetical protein
MPIQILNMTMRICELDGQCWVQPASGFTKLSIMTDVEFMANRDGCWVTLETGDRKYIPARQIKSITLINEVHPGPADKINDTYQWRINHG